MPSEYFSDKLVQGVYFGGATAQNTIFATEDQPLYLGL